MKLPIKSHKKAFKNNKEFNKLRFINGRRIGEPIDEKRIKVKVKGAVLGMIKDNIFDGGAQDVVDYVRKIIKDIV